MSVGKRIKKARNEAGLTQNGLAKKVSVSSQVISNWERDYTKPNSEDIEALSKALEVNPNYLLGGEYSKAKEPDQEYNSLAEINKLVKKYGVEQMGFFNIEEWKQLGPEDIRMLEKQFKLIVEMAKERNQQED